MQKLKSWLARPQVWGFFLSTAIMALLAFVFFYPDNIDGNTLRQADMLQGAANGHEAQVYEQQTGQKALWTNSLFGGMPTFQISPTYPSNALFTWIDSLYGLGLPAPSNLLFMMMMGFFILLVAMRLRWYYALIGAVAWGFSSYFVIIIGAGHIWKFVALAYLPPTVAGLMLAYRGRYICGAAMTAVFSMMALNANHPQMLYYFAFVMTALVIAWLVEAIREKKMKRWLVATAVTLGAGALAVGANLPSLYNTYEYAKETKRAQSELTPTGADGHAAKPEKAPTGGMPYDDIVGWSYGQSETFSLLIPNVKGGATARPEQGGMVYMGLDRLPDAGQYAQGPAGQILPYLPQYFNDSEGTNGPVYVGAVICMLFILGCIIVKGPVKWALLFLTVFSILLAWGRNFEGLTDLMIYHFPMYNKFRAVESILVIAEFTMPLLAVLALREFFGSLQKNKIVTPLAVAAGVCVLFCLVALIFPGAYGDAITAQDRQTSAQLTQQITQMAAQYGYPSDQAQQMAYSYSLANPEVSEAVTSLRYGLVRTDGLRSLIFVLLGAAFMYLYVTNRSRRRIAIAGVGLLVLFDLWGADKRYVSHDSFVEPNPSQGDFRPTQADQAILQDTSYYRVMDVPGFTDARSSYFHHTIGGYHAAKLNRYEDLLQRRLYPVSRVGYIPSLREDSVLASLPEEDRANARHIADLYTTLDMLNARYVITGDADAPVVVNTHALGNAWLIHRLDYVKGADAEMAALTGLDPGTCAVADERFRPVLGTIEGSAAPGDTIALTSYAPDRLTYVSSTTAPAIGVFSEIWFPWGWKATLDGNPAELGRVNYLLRAMRIPAGRHEIVMTFDPDSLHLTGGVAYASVTLIYLLLLLALFVEWRRLDK